jgi:hypothetical protein
VRARGEQGATLIYKKDLTTECQVSLLGDDDRIPPAPRPPAPFPEVQVGPGGIVVTTRCPDFGEVELEVWAGDPGQVAEEWDVIFDGRLETGAGGFDVATVAATVFRVNAPAGSYRVRAEALRDDQKRWFAAVRFIFAESPALQGEAFY